MPARHPDRILRLLLVVAGVAAATLSGTAPPAHADPRSGRWRAPVAGELLAPFTYSVALPFAAGRRRGIDLAATPGSIVGAACAGRVSFAGRLPRGGWGVSVRCGSLTATHLGLGRLAVRRRTTVRAGAALGTVGRSGRVRLGARVTARRFGYVDPLGLIGARRPAPPVAPPGRAPGRAPIAPLGRAPDPGPVPVAHAPRRAPRPAPRLALGGVAPRAGDAVAPVPAIPPAAWAGLVLLACGLPVGGLIHAARRRCTPIPSARWFASSPSLRP